MSTFIIAELSANHNNDIDIALRTIEAMAKSGADAVKIQTYTADSLALDVDNAIFGPKKEGHWKGIRPYDLYKKAATPYEWHPKLKKKAEDLGLVFFSSPFDFKAVDFLEELNCPIYKIASFEINDIPLIKHVASKQKPIIISTGVAELEDIDLAIETCRKEGNNNITLLKCTSQYPARIEDANLACIP
ncbi:MAG: N-acetylneuraminate synthase family protein, partial [Bacteroidota bacterium]